ncbi:MAG: helix-turn-helix transcriptional regulator [Gemmatimonadales bacterium]
MTVGEYLRSFREQTGMSQAEGGEKLGTPQSAVAKLEARDDMLISTFVAYLEALAPSGSGTYVVL